MAHLRNGGIINALSAALVAHGCATRCAYEPNCLPTAQCGLRTADCGLWTVDGCGLSATISWHIHMRAAAALLGKGVISWGLRLMVRPANHSTVARCTPPTSRRRRNANELTRAPNRMVATARRLVFTGLVSSRRAAVRRQRMNGAALNLKKISGKYRAEICLCNRATKAHLK